eukprot:m.15896 g.15896  ORF g.15896 m.15896 type:complete len:79 (-) comp10778_c0_seq1:79-315(-)
MVLTKLMLGLKDVRLQAAAGKKKTHPSPKILPEYLFCGTHKADHATFILSPHHTHVFHKTTFNIVRLGIAFPQDYSRS